MEVDMSDLVEQHVPINRDLALKEGKLDEAVENLLAIEKQARLAADLQATTNICLEIVNLCFDSGNWKVLQDTVSILCKRRGQLKEAIVKTIQRCMEFVDKAPNKETKVEYIESLRAITAGRIHVELESARLTRILSQIREEEGKIGEAADILQDIQVETYGSMEKREKVDFLLEQVRLCMDKGDFVRANIINRKISTKTFAVSGFEDEKIRYYNQMIRYYIHEEDYFKVAECYYHILHTPKVETEEQAWQNALKHVCFFIAAAPYGEQSWDFLNRINAEEKRLEDVPQFKYLLSCFISMELVSWQEIGEGISAAMTFSEHFQGDGKQEYIKVLRKRVIEHNIRVFAAFYTSVRLARLSDLLSVSEDEAETVVAEMVTKGMIRAKIDRSTKQVSFGDIKTAETVLDAWVDDISSLLGLVETTCHLINKENVMRAAGKA